MTCHREIKQKGIVSIMESHIQANSGFLFFVNFKRNRNGSAELKAISRPQLLSILATHNTYILLLIARFNKKWIFCFISVAHYYMTSEHSVYDGNN